ncbi:MAG: signal peptidase [Actinomycetota bacterium]
MTSTGVDPGRRRRPLITAAAVAVVVLVIDQVTKHLAVSRLSDGDVVHVVWTLQWNLAFNSGMAFGKAGGLGPIIGIAALVVAGVVLGAARKSPDLWVTVAAGLVAGGAIGNVIDRLFRGEAWMRGAVVDFIDFQWFPIFNVADIGVDVGAGLFILWSLTRGRKKQDDVA